MQVSEMWEMCSSRFGLACAYGVSLLIRAFFNGFGGSTHIFHDVLRLRKSVVPFSVTASMCRECFFKVRWVTYTGAVPWVSIPMLSGSVYAQETWLALDTLAWFQGPALSTGHRMDLGGASKRTLTRPTPRASQLSRQSGVK
ncbi:hypothetical protein, unlikely [Trypanosoma congolense IL3000]|uniref:Uncharacterized protein n=1 Tax=Trypanosoma congolense (strain IL3000) TaxID=1068625 RepID=F9WBG7_TRYCI|nr:hypothetical protein, unlikely [Trypanosoma congolense IL3000]